MKLEWIFSFRHRLEAQMVKYGMWQEDLILCPPVTIPVTLDEPVNLNENIQAWCAQSQPWLTLCVHFHFKLLIYIYEALTVWPQWCWLTEARSFIHSFIYGIY